MKLDVVAEIFNPKRFGEHAESTGLRQGEAFDIVLGDNLLLASERKKVKFYLENNRPGLTCVSPPCVMFSILQNLNMKYLNSPEKLREYARKLTEAKILLNFAAEMCQLVALYGGTFVFEHLLTSKACKETKVQQLLSDPRTYFAKNDQCAFQLRSAAGGLHRKPTGWMTNSEEIYKVLNVRCQGGHEHEPVLGGGVGGHKSRLAQHYTTELVRTILSAYRRTLQEPRTMVSVMTLDEYLHECYIVDQIIKQETDENEVAKNTAVLQNDQVSQSNEMISNEHATVEKEVLTNDIYHEAEEEGAEERGEAEAVNPDDEEEERYRPLPRERPFSSLAQLVKRAHDGLGHPARDKFTRILKEAKASPEAIQEARKLRCSTCKKHAQIHPHRAAAPPRELRFNQVVGVDTTWLPGPDPGGKQHMALNVVDWATGFQLI